MQGVSFNVFYIILEYCTVNLRKTKCFIDLTLSQSGVLLLTFQHKCSRVKHLKEYFTSCNSTWLRQPQYGISLDLSILLELLLQLYH